MNARLHNHRRGFAALTAACVVVFALSVVARAAAQESPDVSGVASDATAAPADPLPEIEGRLAERYDRLELLAGRLAELTGSTQPRRAELLRQLIARGRQNDVTGQFDEIIAALGDESFTTAIDGQARLNTELQKLLELLLQEDRDRQLETERKRVLRYLQDVNKLIRLQRGVKARTDGGDDAEELADDQERVGNETGKLQQEIEDSEATPQSSEGDDSGKPNGGKSSGSESQPPKPNDEDAEDAEQPEDDEEGEDAESEDKPAGEQSEGEQQSGEQQSGEQQPGGQQSDGQPQSGSPSDGSPQEPQQSPMQRAAERLKQAQQRMQDAQKQLEQAQRGGAQAEQDVAIEELEQAKADLERILRQLREEEMERMLVLLEARFRKMLDEQNEVYEETKKLDKAAATAPEHELEIAAGRQSRRERLIVREADRCLVLLREDGTSVAFPEAVEQARDDMKQIAERLNRVKVDLITQTMEEDVIAALEETLGMLQETIDKLRDQKAQPQGGGGGGSGEQSLVDQLAELRMIRALQVRVNNRTKQYGALIEGEQALEDELLGLLDELALRQAKIFQATDDLDLGRNQ